VLIVLPGWVLPGRPEQYLRFIGMPMSAAKPPGTAGTACPSSCHGGYGCGYAGAGAAAGRLGRMF
jgi:hypothetical protein